MSDEQKATELKSHARFSTIGVKKRVASKIGETKLGRATLVSMLGNEGDAIVKALKNAVAKIDSREKAKHLKKDTLKWILKASALVNHGLLNDENTAHLQRPLQIWAESLIKTFDEFKVGERDMNDASEGLYEIGQLLECVLEPLAHEKNVNKITQIVNYYAAVMFLDKLFNSVETQDEAAAISSSIRNILLPLPRALNDETTIKLAGNRQVLIQEVLSRPSLFMCFNAAYPEIGSSFAAFLDSSSGPTFGSLYRFLLAEEQFSGTRNAKIRAERSRTILAKYEKALSSNAETQAAFRLACERTNAVTVPRTVFSSLKQLVLPMLDSEFVAFLSSSHFKDLESSLAREMEYLQNTLGNTQSNPTTRLA